MEVRFRRADYPEGMVLRFKWEMGTSSSGEVMSLGWSKVENSRRTQRLHEVRNTMCWNARGIDSSGDNGYHLSLSEGGVHCPEERPAFRKNKKNTRPPKEPDIVVCV